MKQELDDKQKELVNAATEDLIGIYCDLCRDFGFESTIAKRLDTILAKLENFRTKF